MQRQHEKSAAENRQMQHHDAAVGLIHERLQLRLPVFSAPEIIVAERNSVTDREAEERPPEMVLSHELVQSVHARNKSALVFESAAEKGDHKRSMHRCETAVMDTEERDEEQFGRPTGGVARRREQHFQYI